MVFDGGFQLSNGGLMGERERPAEMRERGSS